MSLGLVCDACGETLLADCDVRYLLRIEGYAAYDPLEITRDDLERDLDSEIRSLLERLRREDPDKAQSDVHREFRLDLCPSCWRLYREDPLAGFRELVERRRGDPSGRDETGADFDP